MSRTILITGASGLLAPYLVQAAGNCGNVVTTSRTQGDVFCDLTNLEQTRAMLQTVKPDWVIHTAAMTNVDLCESNPLDARQVNTVAVEHIAENLESKTHLAFLSTDQVYPDTAGLHREGSEDPVNVYGSTKLEGERNALKHAKCVAFRANLFGHSMTTGRASLDDFVVNGLREAKAITLFDDVLFSPLHMTTLSQLICESLEKQLCGVFNAGCREGLSKAAFGFVIAEHLHLSTGTVTVGQSISFKQRARRTLDLRMDVSKLEAALGRSMPTLRQEIERL